MQRLYKTTPAVVQKQSFIDFFFKNIPILSRMDSGLFRLISLWMIFNPNLTYKFTQIFFCYLKKALREDSIQTNWRNILELRHIHIQTENFPEILREIGSTLGSLRMRFVPLLAEARKQTDRVYQSIFIRKAHVSELENQRRNFDFERLDASLASFETRLYAIVEKHKNHTMDVVIVQDKLKKVNEAFETANSKLAKRKEEYLNIVSEIKDLQEKIIKAGLENDSEYQILQSKAQLLLDKRDSSQKRAHL